MKMFSSTLSNTTLKLQLTQEHAHYRNCFYSLAVGKGRCYHPTSQRDNYTRYYQPLMARLLGHERQLSITISVQRILSLDISKWPKTLGAQLCSVFHEEQNIWEQIFTCSPFVHTQLHTCTLQIMACQLLMLANTFLFCWNRQATRSYLFCALVSV